jgi:hypothetical protein
VLYFRLPERRRVASSQRECRYRCHPFCPRRHVRNRKSDLARSSHRTRAVYDAMASSGVKLVT